LSDRRRNKVGRDGELKRKTDARKDPEGRTPRTEDSEIGPTASDSN